MQVCGPNVQPTLPAISPSCAPGCGRLPSRNALPAGPSRGKPRRGGEGPAQPLATAALRAWAPEDPATPPSPRAFPRVTFQGAWSARRVPGRLYGNGASGPPGAPLGPEGPRRPLPPAPQWRRHGPRRQARSGPSPRARLCPRPAGPAVGRNALTRCSAPSGGRGSRSRPSWGRSCWAWRAPPAAVSAAPWALGPWRGDPAAGRGARWGRRRNAEGRTRRRDSEAWVRPTPRNLGGGLGGTGDTASGDARGARTESRCQAWGRGCGGVVRTWPTRGPAGGQSAGRAVPGRGRWHLRPMRARRGRYLGQSPGVPAAATQWLRAGRTTCRAGHGPPAANGGARGPALPRNQRRCRVGPERRPLGGVGPRGPCFPGGAPALQRPENLLKMQAISGAPAHIHGIETPAVCANKPWVFRR